MIRFFLGVSLVLALLSAAAQAVELLGPPRITVNADSATLTWRTDVPCGTRLSLGTDLNKLQPKAEGGVTDNHTVTLTGLTPGVTYYYAVSSAKQKLGAGTIVIPVAGGSASSSAPATAVPSSKSVVERLRDALVPKPQAKTLPSAPQPPPVFPGSGSSSGSVQRPPPAAAPPSSRTWGNLASLPDHFARHGADFQSRNQDDYAAKAWLFLQRARTQPLPMKLDEDGTLRVWEAKTGTFAAYNHDGTTKTFFKPGSGTYWQRQPGRMVSPMELPPSLQARR